MNESSDMKNFLDEYEKYVQNILKPTRDEIKDFFRGWKDPGHWARYARVSRLPSPSPVQRAIVRIKRPESVVDKILRKPSSFPDGLSLKSLEKMHDAVAGRIIVYFLANLPMIDREIRENESLETSAENSPIAYLSEELLQRFDLHHLQRQRKESGYASIHYFVRLRHSSVSPAERPWFELQVRTLAEDLWGEVEHILGYKPNKRTSFAVRKQFQIISSELMAIDEHFNLLFEELTRFQEESLYRDEDPLNAENLPAVLSELGIGCAQSEIDGLLKLLMSRGLETVGQIREGASGSRLEIIRDIYRKRTGNNPTNFDIISGLAASRGLREEEQVVDAVINQIEFLKSWEKLKKTFNLDSR